VDPRRGSAGLLAAIVLITGLGGAGWLGWWLPKQAARTRARNERNAGSTLTILSSAEADYRANDRDGNGVLDFWTGDVASLYRLGLIPRELAEADARPRSPLVPTPVPFRGYLFMALDFDESVTPPEPYRQDTDLKSGKVHHTEKFGFVAYPAEPGVTGEFIYIVNENNTAFRTPVGTTAMPGNWPSDPAIMQSWSKIW
jgi:hypothetical protein